MHADTQKLTPSAFDSAALIQFDVQALLNDEACDPMGPCQSDGNESGLAVEFEALDLGESANATTPPEPQNPDPEVCDPMGPCQSDGNESGLVGDLDASH